MHDVVYERWGCLSNTETVQLQTAKRGYLVNRRQLDVLNVVAAISDRLILKQLSESSIEGSARIVVEVDRSLRVSIDTDGYVGLED